MLTLQRSRDPLFPFYFPSSLLYTCFLLCLCSCSTFSKLTLISSTLASCTSIRTSEPLVRRCAYGINYNYQGISSLHLSTNNILTMDYNSSYQPYQHNRYSTTQTQPHHQPVSHTIITRQPSSLSAHQQTFSQEYQEASQHHHHVETPHVRYVADGLPQVKVSTYPYNQTGAHVQSLHPVSSSNQLHPPPAPPPSASTSPQTLVHQHHHHQPQHLYSQYNNPQLPNNLRNLKTPVNPTNAAVRQQYQQQQQQHVLPPTSPIVPVTYTYPYVVAAGGAGACGSSDSSSPTAYPFPVAATLTAQQQREQNQQRRHIQQQNSQLNEQFIFPHLIHQRQRGLQPIQRRWYLWAIGILDIIAVVWTTSLVIRDAFLKPIADPNEFIWYFFWTSLVILARFTMGMCLIIGLHSSDDPSTLWYCRMWMWCQYFVFVMLIPELFTSFGSLLNTPTDTLWQKSIPLKFILVLSAVIYRIVCYLLVKKFINRLEKCESVFLDRVHQRQLQEDRDRRRSQDQGDGETSFCGPSIALIMSL